MIVNSLSTHAIFDCLSTQHTGSMNVNKYVDIVEYHIDMILPVWWESVFACGVI